MEAKIGKFLESVTNFFTGADQIPWCDRDIVAVSSYLGPHFRGFVKISRF
uniref:Uncharacterized protein n=1 Tax=Rhizophora mucronata TaxID=61149 RepID=A0A2P2K6X4_RHIMU